MASVPAVALGVAGLAGVGPQLLRSRPLLSSLLVAGGVFGLVHWQLERLFSEEPDFTLEERIDELEIRRYGSRIVAETTVFPAADDGDEAFEQALSEGFKRLAGYIFRGNASEEKIAMTSPVNASLRSNEALGQAPEDGYLIRFTMPKKFDLASLPKPDDARVHLRAVPGARIAVLRYSGTHKGTLSREKQSELLARVRIAGLRAIGAPAFAGYDAPSTLPFLRRIEAWVEIE